MENGITEGSVKNVLRMWLHSKAHGLNENHLGDRLDLIRTRLRSPSVTPIKHQYPPALNWAEMHTQLDPQKIVSSKDVLYRSLKAGIPIMPHEEYQKEVEALCAYLDY